MRILFLTHYFPPESNAPAVRTYEHCRVWVEQGHEVHVLTCIPSHPRGVPYPGWGTARSRAEIMDGIHVHRVWTYLAPNQGFLKRTLNFVSFVLPATWRSLRVGPIDVIVATSPQFFCAFAGWLTSGARRRPWVFEVRDLWPESIEAVGAMRSQALLGSLRSLANFLYSRADSIVCLTHSFVRALEAEGVDSKKLHYVPNGVDRATWSQEPGGSDWRLRLGVAEDTPLIGYVGTMGMAHGLQTVLEAAEILKDAPDSPQFVLAGDGSDRDRLQRLAQERGLSNVMFTGQIQRAEIPSLLATLDIALVVLRDKPLFQTVLPSKMFEAMAAGRPVALGVGGEAARVLDRSGGGVSFEPENAVALAAVLTRLISDPRERERLGECGRAFVASEFDRGVLALRMSGILQDLATRGHLLGASGTASPEWPFGRRSRWAIPALPPFGAQQSPRGTRCDRPRVSLVVPLRNEERHLDRFLASLSKMDLPTEPLEILLVEGRSRDRTRELLEAEIPHLLLRHPDWQVQLLENPSGTTPDALNLGILASHGDVIVRLDAHSLFPATYLRDLLQTLKETKASNVGGVVRTVPGADTPTARAIAQARSDLFGAGRSPFRTGARSGPQKTVPFGCFPRATFEVCGLYDARLKRNQDLELNHRIREAGGVVYQDGRVVSDHIAPSTLPLLFRKHFANGKWNIYCTLVAPGSVSLAHYVPGLLVLVLAAAFFHSPVLGWALFGAAALADLLRATRVRRDVPMLALAAAFAAIQLGHGLGQCVGALLSPVFLFRSALSFRQERITPRSRLQSASA